MLFHKISIFTEAINFTKLASSSLSEEHYNVLCMEIFPVVERKLKTRLKANLRNLQRKISWQFKFQSFINFTISTSCSYQKWNETLCVSLLHSFNLRPKSNDRIRLFRNAALSFLIKFLVIVMWFLDSAERDAMWPSVVYTGSYLSRNPKLVAFLFCQPYGVKVNAGLNYLAIFIPIGIIMAPLLIPNDFQSHQ